MVSFAIEMSDMITELMFAADNVDVVQMAISELTDLDMVYKNALFMSVDKIQQLAKQMENHVEEELARWRAENGKRKGTVQG